MKRQSLQARLGSKLTYHACVALWLSGMDFEGIYRKTGGAGQVKQITQLFESTDSVALDNEDWDISAVTSVLKNYFRGLENPLYTFELHQEFVSVAGVSCWCWRHDSKEVSLNPLEQNHLVQTVNVSTH